MLVALVLPDLVAQGSNRTVGLAWSELFTMLLPAVAVTVGSNLRAGPYLGLGRPRPLPIALGALLGAAGFVAATGVMGLWALALPRRVLEWFPDIGRIFEGSPLSRAALAAVAALLAPLCEEVAFRGYLQRTLLRAVGPASAIALAAVLFAARHLDPVRFPALALLGALFGWLAWRGGSLWPAIAGHAANNAIAVAAALALGRASEAARPGLREALVPLLVGILLMAGLAAAFRAATPPPSQDEALPRRNPDDPSTRFRMRLVPGPLLALATAGLAALVTLVVFARP